jgi:carboxypeptidase C (cathepsin A)
VIYLDSPAGIGFSLCGNLSECRFNDSYSGNDNVAAALQLLTVKFPALKDNDLWLSGQGYSGIFVPWLARGLDQWINQTRTLDPLAWVPKLKGILVGNGFTDFKYDGLPAFVTMAHYHGLIDDELFDALGQCNLTYVNVKGYGNFSEQCINSIQTFNYYTSFANNFDIYGYCFKGWEMPSQLPGHESLALRSLQQVPGNFIPCLWTKPMVDYYNNQTVKTQLNIKPEMLTSNWTACTYPGINNFSYSYNISGSVWIYNELRGKGYRLLAYSGDTDSLIPTLGTQQWINAQGWNVTEAWRPYYIPVTADTKKVAGYVEVRGDFTLATVHGGGHQAAKNRRQQTYQAVFNFINNVPL